MSGDQNSDLRTELLSCLFSNVLLAHEKSVTIISLLLYLQNASYDPPREFV